MAVGTFGLGLHEYVTKKKAEYQQRQFIKQYFNGSIVSEITGLQGKELGEFISKFKAQYSNFDTQILRYISNKTLNETIEKFHKEQSNSPQLIYFNG